MLKVTKLRASRKYKAGLSVALAAAMVMSAFPAAFIPAASAAVSKTISVDFNDVKGPMVPKTGLMLVPNYNLPDGRITPLKVPRLRDDYDNQNILNYSPNDQVNVWNYEDTRLARVKSGAERLNSLNIAYNPIFSYTPSWLSKNGDMSAPNSLPLYKQWVKDNVQYAKDNNLNITKFGVWNENWNISNDEYKEMYKAAWSGVKEVMPDAMINGNSLSGYDQTQDFMQYVNDNGLTVESLAWHEFGSENDIQGHVDNSRMLTATKFPNIGIKETYIEEYAGDAGTRASLVNWLAALEDANVDMALKSHWTWNASLQGFGDLVDFNSTQANSVARRDTWWAMKAYAEMSGSRVGVTQPADAAAIRTRAIASKDTAVGEAKILIGNSNNDVVNLTLNLNNQPFQGQTVRIDKYKVTTTENNGLVLQSVENPASSQNLTTNVSMAVNDVWLIVIKKVSSAPGSFTLIGPDDDVMANTTPTLTWQAASGAASYNVKVSANKNLASPLINQTGVTGTSFTVGTALNVGTRYYWSVTAVNANGSTPAANNMYYSFLVGSNLNVPGRMAMYLVPNYAKGIDVRPKFTWSPAYNATSYILQVDNNSDFSSPEINAANLTATENDSNMGGPHQVYTPTSDLAFNTTYYARVFAVNANGSRIMTEAAHQFTTKPSGNAPGGFTISAPASGSTNVSRRGNLKWSESNGAFFYKLEVSTNSAFSSIVLSRDHITANSYTLGPDELNANTAYYWRVTAYTKNLSFSTAASNNGYSFTTENKAAAPLLKAVGEGNGSATVNFSTVSGASSYTIKYGTSPGNYTNSVTGVSNSPRVLTGLTNNQKYYFAVTAVNANGETAIFNEINATPKAGVVYPVNLALNKPANASSVADNTLSLSAFDGNNSTRWTSAYSDNQWISVDLGAVTNITKVNLNWEAAYGKSYKIQVSNDAANWTDVYSTTTGDGGNDAIAFTASGRYVRMLGIQRATVYGYSLWEFEVYGTSAASSNLALNRPATASSLADSTVAASAVDGNSATRWSSAYSDPQSIYVDLGFSQSVSRVKLNWEAAYASSFKIQVSNDASAWTDVYSMTIGAGGVQSITFTPTNARYVRMYGTQRATIYGYSLWDFEVYGS